MKESELFAPVKDFLLHHMNCEKVFAEVVNLDVVGKHGNVYVGVEMKTSLNFKVIEQAEERKYLVDYMFILVPKPKSYHAQLVLDWLKHLGIGLMYYDEEFKRTTPIRIYFWGKRQRHTKRRRIDYYIDEQLDSLNVGGVKGGESLTPYKCTIDKIKHLLYTCKEGLTINDILDNVQTHYSSPKPSVTATLKAEWNASWCEREMIDGQIIYRMKEAYREPYWKEYQSLKKEFKDLRRSGRV